MRKGIPRPALSVKPPGDNLAPRDRGPFSAKAFLFLSWARPDRRLAPIARLNEGAIRQVAIPDRRLAFGGRRTKQRPNP